MEPAVDELELKLYTAKARNRASELEEVRSGARGRIEEGREREQRGVGTIEA
jgi:hypothetical protein